MRTTLNIEDKLIDKASKLTGIKEKTSSDQSRKQQKAGKAWGD